MSARAHLPILLLFALFAAASPAGAGSLPVSEGFARDGDYVGAHWYPDGEYIPGYGQQDPEYTYAHTGTVSVSLVGHHWREVCREIPAKAVCAGTAAVEFLPALRDRVDGLEELSGTIVETCPGVEPSATVAVKAVRFLSRRDERYAALRRNAIERANYELWRKPKGVFMPKWERVGESYRLTDRPEEVWILTGTAE